MNNVALLRQQVVFDVQPVHGLEVTLDHGGRDQLGDFGDLVVPGLELVQRVEPVLLVRLVLLVPGRGARVDVPTYVVKARLASQFLDLVFCFLFDLNEPDHDVRDLDAGVVDVVLDIDLASAGAQQANKRVTQNRIPQVPDVGGFVRVYRGMFNDYFTFVAHPGLGCSGGDF